MTQDELIQAEDNFLARVVTYIENLELTA